MTTYVRQGPGAAVFGHPLYSSFVSFPTACFVLTLLCDIAYWRTGILQWQTFAEWLLFAGLVVGGFVLLAAVVGLFTRSAGPGALHALGILVVLALAFVNSLVHARDGWTAVVPQGLILSAATVVVMILTGLVGRARVRRQIKGATRNV
jgi:uncharacterized membrane protein